MIAVTVEEPIVVWTPSWDERNWRRDVERDIETWVAPLADAGVSVEAVASEKPASGDGLVGVASARAADLLVLGTRGLGGFTGLRFGCGDEGAASCVASTGAGAAPRGRMTPMMLRLSERLERVRPAGT